MKKRFYLLSVILSIFLVSCVDDGLGDDVKTEITGLTENVYYEEIDTIHTVGLREHYEAMIQEASQGNSDDDAALLSYAQEQLNAVDAYEQECINQAGANWDPSLKDTSGKNRLLGYQYTAIKYTSVDEYNQPITLSTLVVWPYNNILSNPDPNNVIIGCHITITSDKERPSNYVNNSITTDVGMLACAAKSNGLTSAYENLVIIPDYQGFGLSKDRTHPYLYQDLTARQVLDGVTAGMEYFKKKRGSMEKNWHSISMGYSQGGSVAMAVHRYIEKNDLSDKFKFKGSVCGNGPYDPIVTIKKYIKTNKINMPVAVGLILKGMCDCNPHVRGKYKAEDYFTAKFMDTGILDMIDTKQKNTGAIQKHLINYSMKNGNNPNSFVMYGKKKNKELPYIPANDSEPGSWSDKKFARTTDVMRPEVIAYFKGEAIDDVHKDKMDALYKALEMNVLHKDWTPSHPMFVVHSQEDEVVPFANYEVCRDISAWNSKFKGIQYAGRTQSHVNFGKYFFMLHSGMATVALFSGTTAVHMHDRVDYGI